MEVEASGGFDRLTRLKMLFEPHVFWRNLSGAARTRAASLGLAYAAWKPGAYPTGSYLRLTQATAIDETAALKAASWGLGQILGENHRAAGYATLQVMVLAFCNSGEAEHLAAMVRFIVTNGLDDDLRRHKWGPVRPRLQRGELREARLPHQAREGLRQVVEDQGYAVETGHGRAGG